MARSFRQGFSLARAENGGFLVPSFPEGSARRRPSIESLVAHKRSANRILGLALRNKRLDDFLGTFRVEYLFQFLQELIRRVGFASGSRDATALDFHRVELDRIVLDVEEVVTVSHQGSGKLKE